MTAEIHDERFRQVVGGAIAFEKLATGFGFTEGPIWHPRARHLTFSDIPGDQMHRWSAAGGDRPRSASRRTRPTATPTTAPAACCPASMPPAG